MGAGVARPLPTAKATGCINKNVAWRLITARARVTREKVFPNEGLCKCRL